jgi:hypothetical protein
MIRLAWEDGVSFLTNQSALLLHIGKPQEKEELQPNKGRKKVATHVQVSDDDGPPDGLPGRSLYVVGVCNEGGVAYFRASRAPGQFWGRLRERGKRSQTKALQMTRRLNDQPDQEAQGRAGSRRSSWGSQVQLLLGE